MARQKILAVPGTGRIDLTRASEGCVVCYFNPTNMTLDQAQKGSKKMIEYIESCSTANA